MFFFYVAFCLSGMAALFYFIHFLVYGISHQFAAGGMFGLLGCMAVLHFRSHAFPLSLTKTPLWKSYGWKYRVVALVGWTGITVLAVDNALSTQIGFQFFAGAIVMFVFLLGSIRIGGAIEKSERPDLYL